MNRAVLTLSVGAVLIAGSLLLAQPGSIIAPPGQTIIVVTVPADAVVMIDGQTMKQQGPERRYQTAKLAPGTYVFEITAIWKAKDKEMKELRKVKFRPGEVKYVDFLKPVKKAPETTPPDKDKKDTD